MRWIFQHDSEFPVMESKFELWHSQKQQSNGAFHGKIEKMLDNSLKCMHVCVRDV